MSYQEYSFDVSREELESFLDFIKELNTINKTFHRINWTNDGCSIFTFLFDIGNKAIKVEEFKYCRKVFFANYNGGDILHIMKDVINFEKKFKSLLNNKKTKQFKLTITHSDNEACMFKGENDLITIKSGVGSVNINDLDEMLHLFEDDNAESIFEVDVEVMDEIIKLSKIATGKDDELSIFQTEGEDDIYIGDDGEWTVKIAKGKLVNDIKIKKKHFNIIKYDVKKDDKFKLKVFDTTLVFLYQDTLLGMVLQNEV